MLGENVKNAILYWGRGLFKNAIFRVILIKARLIQIHKHLNSYKFLFSEMGPENGV